MCAATWFLSATLQTSDIVHEPRFRQLTATQQQLMTSKLLDHGIDVQTPDHNARLNSRAHSVLADILNALQKTHSATHCGFFLIGQARKMFEHHVIDRSYRQEIQAQIRAAIDKLQRYCVSTFPDGFSNDAIYFRLQQTEGNPERIKQLLMNQPKPMTVL